MTRYAKYLLLLAVAFTGACQQQIVTTDALPANAPAPDSAELAFTLATKDWCTNNEAASLVLAFVEGADRYTTFEQRLEALEQRDLARADWNLQADQPVTKGTLAYMLCHALDLKGGILYNVLPIRRYAYREALDAGMIERGADYEPMTGPEALASLHYAATFEDKTSQEYRP